MATINNIKSLYGKTLEKMTEDHEGWLSFLKTASRFYKYSFEDQILIYAQRPDALACAKIDFWNKQEGRWVKKHAKGIALLRKNTKVESLDYIFDLADTWSSKQKYPYIWELTKDAFDPVKIGLLNRFSIKDQGELSVTEAMLKAVGEEVKNTYLESFKCYKDQLSQEELEDFNEDEERKNFRNLARLSSQFIVLERSGFEPEIFMDVEGFREIKAYQGNEQLGNLGQCINGVSREVLREVGNVVRNFDLEKQKGLDNSLISSYNKANKINSAKYGRRPKNEYQVQTGGGFSHSGSRSESSRGIREVWRDERSVHKGEQARDLVREAHGGNLEPISHGSGRSSGIETRGRDKPSEGSRRRDGRTEGERSNGMGGSDEQHHGTSQGDRHQRDHREIESFKEETDLQVSFLPGVKEQIEVIRKAEDKEPSAFLMPKLITDEVIDRCLSALQQNENTRLLITAHFRRIENLTENGTFLRKMFRNGGAGFLIEKKEVALWHSESGIEIALGRSARRGLGTAQLTWEEAADRIHHLLENGNYVARDEFLKSNEVLYQSVANSTWHGIRDFSEEYIKEHPEFKRGSHGHPEDTKQLIAQFKEVNELNHYIDLFEKANQDYIKDPEIMGFKIYNPGVVLKQLQILAKEAKSYPLYEKVDKATYHFVTQDEVEYYLLNENGHSKETIIKFFSEETDRKKRSEFLKHYYGHSGSHWTDTGIDFNSKGFSLVREYNDVVYDKVQKNWQNVAMTIGKILDNQRDEVLGINDVPQSRREVPKKQEAVKIHKEVEVVSGEKPHKELQRVPRGLAENVKNHGVNFMIKEHDLVNAGTKESFKQNVNALLLLKALEKEGRMATGEEQILLNRYAGWGGLAAAFDPKNEKWEKEYLELKELLEPTEYESAKSSVLNAHYTPPEIISGIYSGLLNTGLVMENVLDPAMGTGRFFGCIPDEMKKVNLYGVELDGLSGRIAKQLYPEAQIEVMGYEKAEVSNNFFDAAIGNVPFGDYKVLDQKYNRHHFLIHDYFFAKTLDKLRPGGVLAFMTSKGTLDKENESFRRYMAEKVNFLGAIRLPDNAFKSAGTQVTTDIIFLQKRNSVNHHPESWLKVLENDEKIHINEYFLSHPEMILGEMKMVSGAYGMESTCKERPGQDLGEAIEGAISNLELPDDEILNLKHVTQSKKSYLSADPSVRNYSYTRVEDKLYYRVNSKMEEQELPVHVEGRVLGMMEIRDTCRRMIELQMNFCTDEVLKGEQEKLLDQYERFTQKYGRINHLTNRRAFHEDASYPLLSSLETLDDKGELNRLADIFYKRTIYPQIPIEQVDTPNEALVVSLREKGCVDIGYMAQLLGGQDKALKMTEDLRGVIFKDPEGDIEDFYADWLIADEYLSGNVREKLVKAKALASENHYFSQNVEALEIVQPKDLTPAEIEVKLGATWIDVKYYREFMYETFGTSPYLKANRSIDIAYSKLTAEWNVCGKTLENSNNVKVHTTYGTKRKNAYSIFENALNLRDTRIMDKNIDEHGKEVSVLNPKETAISQQKQEALTEAFEKWIWKDLNRREDLCLKYNQLFNAVRPRAYDGGHLTFSGMNPEIRLNPHQKNAVASILYGKNTLLAHCVGAGKTFSMTAAAMESKRLGLCQKPLFVVPNHLTEQWGAEIITLYNGANILVATKKDFEKDHRKAFCAKIATGDYDAIVIGHTQFERLPLSKERQEGYLKKQIAEIVSAVTELKKEREQNFTIKQMVGLQKKLEIRLEKLQASGKKDNTIDFEELGIDRIFVDEAHNFKNLYMHTKMRNVAGIPQTDSQKSSDMYYKCQYMDELTSNKGIVFATGTPVSNSMVELYTMMRYLQADALKKMGLEHFDSWAANFGEKVTSIELAPEGTGFQSKTRFSRFFNLPELMSIWKESADIQTQEMLNLPVPKATYETIATEPSKFQREIVFDFARRADDVRRKQVTPDVDNMLKITGDGRKLALDQRLHNNLLPDDEKSKVNLCIEKVFIEWQQSEKTKGTQLLFCDLSTPGKKDDFTVYQDIKEKLIKKDIPESEIAFIHDVKTERAKAALFSKVRQGSVRVLIGSTAKMGAGTNVQDKIVALHHLDCPWRPSDIEQREGRAIRQGNENGEVKLYRYVTEGTFDAYNWSILENKQKFIGQIMTGKSPARSVEDLDSTALSYAEVKALAIGDPRIKEKMDLDIKVAKLKILEADYRNQQYEMENRLVNYFPKAIDESKNILEGLKEDMKRFSKNPLPGDGFLIEIKGTFYEKRSEGGQALLDLIKAYEKPVEEKIGTFQGFDLYTNFSPGGIKFKIKGELSYAITLGSDPTGNMTRMTNLLGGLHEKLSEKELHLEGLIKDMKNTKEELKKPFEKNDEVLEKSERLNALNIALSHGIKEEDERKNDGNVSVNHDEMEMEI